MGPRSACPFVGGGRGGGFGIDSHRIKDLPQTQNMADPTPQPVHLLEIKKYPNRRLYDATRSCHVTLTELYDLVAAGHTVCVRDSKSGEDITNQVLLQALIERDPLKITAVPSPLIHLMIRLNHSLITSWFDLGLRQAMGAYGATAGSPWTGGWPTASAPWPGAWTGLGAVPPSPPPAASSPLAWLASFMQPPTPPTTPPDPSPEPADEPAPEDAEPDLERLQSQIAELAAELARLKTDRDEPPASAS